MSNDLPREPPAAQTCSCTQKRIAARWSMTGGILGALGICAACCVLPAALMALGITGAWVSALDRVAAYKVYLIVATIALLGSGFYLTRARGAACAAGSACTSRRPTKVIRVALWLGVVVALGSLLFEAVAAMVGIAL
jgi:mercuric ion transport protein